MIFEGLKLELEKRCLDLGQTKRPDARYGEGLNNSLSQYPLELCPRTVDETTLDTVADTREYNLSGVATLVVSSQVRRVWIDDGNDIKREVGRYEVRGQNATLTLVLDFTPTADRDITVEFWAPLLTMTNPADTCEADDDWLLAKAMVALMGEADWEIEDPQLTMSQVEYWNARAMNREAQLMGGRYRSSRKPRTVAWRGSVT